MEYCVSLTLSTTIRGVLSRTVNILTSKPTGTAKTSMKLPRSIGMFNGLRNSSLFLANVLFSGEGLTKMTSSYLREFSANTSALQGRSVSLRLHVLRIGNQLMH